MLMPLLLLQNLLFPSLMFCYCCYLTWYICFSPNALKGRACIFFLSLLCLPYKCRNEHYFWNIFKITLWWFTVLCLCKHFVFSPTGNQLFFWIFCNWYFLSVPGLSVTELRWVPLKAFASYSLISCRVISPQGWFSLPFVQLLLLLHAAAVYFLLSLQGECLFHWRTVPNFWTNPKAVFAAALEAARVCMAPCPFSDRGYRTLLRSLRAGKTHGGTSLGHLCRSGPPNPHRHFYQPTSDIYSLSFFWAHL